MATVKIEGLKELDDALGLLSDRMAKSTLTRAGKKALVPFLEEVDIWVPVGDPSKSPNRPPGALRASYIIGTKLNKSQSRQVRRAGKNYVEVYAGTNDMVGIWQEFGTEDFPPQAHARPAWDRTQDLVLVTLKDELAIEVDAALKRAKLPPRTKG